MTQRLTFLNILKSSLWGTKLEIRPSSNELAKVFGIAKSQSVLGLVANVVLTDAEIAKELSPDVQKRLRTFVMSNMATHSKLNKILIQVVSLLSESGITSVLLKGQGIAKNYPIPELRQCGDIDLYVGEQNYYKVHSLLSPLSSAIDDLDSLSDGKHFHLVLENVIIEVHRFAEVLPSPTYNKAYQEYALMGLTHNLNVIDFEGVKINTPADDFNAFYIFNHLWYHFMTEGVGLRQICDWMFFLHAKYDSINVAYLESILKRMNLVVPWKTFGCILVDHLGMPASEFPLYDSKYSSKASCLLSRILDEGNFGRERAYHAKPKTGNYFYDKIKSLSYHLIRYFKLFYLFPLPTVRQFKYMIKAGFATVKKDKFDK